MLLVGCSTVDYDVEHENQKMAQMGDKYLSLSSKPIVSALDLALGKTLMTKGETPVLGLTKDDADYIISLDENELKELESQVIEKWGYTSQSEIEHVSDGAFMDLFSDMDPEEYYDLDKFISDYLEMPGGVSSIEKLFTNRSNSVHPKNVDLYINAALCIDNYGRVLYDAILETRATSLECKKYFAARIALASVNMLAGMITCTAAPLIAIITICDAASATADYYRCMKNR